MSVVLDQIAADAATLTRLVSAPTGNLGYGRDLSCVTDVTDAMDEVDPFSTQGISESIARRLSTPRGALADDPNYGYDLRGFCNRGVTAMQLREVSGAVYAEVKKDDRVNSAIVTVTQPSQRALSVALRITPEDPALNAFNLVLAVTDGAVLVEALS